MDLTRDRMMWNRSYEGNGDEGVFKTEHYPFQRKDGLHRDSTELGMS